MLTAEQLRQWAAHLDHHGVLPPTEVNPSAGDEKGWKVGATGSASALGWLTFHCVGGRSGGWHIGRRCGIFTRRGTCTS